MKTQTRDLKKCISKRFVENIEYSVAGALAIIAIIAILVKLMDLCNPLFVILLFYYLIIIGIFTVAMIINRKLKGGIINFIKRFIILSVIFPLVMILAMIDLLCTVGFALAVSIISGIAYLVWFNGDSFILFGLIALISGLIAMSFAMALDDCLKMSKWLGKVAGSIGDLIILEDDSSL